MKDLIARLESAADADQYDLIGAAIIHAHDNGWISNVVYGEAIRLLNCGAFIDAALRLLPEAWRDNWDIKWRKEYCWVELFRPSHEIQGRGRKPALALCAAALKTWEAQG